MRQYASIHFKRQHHLSGTQARAIVEELAKQLKGKLGAEYHWDGDTLYFHRIGASGSVDLGEGEVEVEVKLGFMLAPMKGRIESTIKEGFEAALAESGDSEFA